MCVCVCLVSESFLLLGRLFACNAIGLYAPLRLDHCTISAAAGYHPQSTTVFYQCSVVVLLLPLPSLLHVNINEFLGDFCLRYYRANDALLLRLSTRSIHLSFNSIILDLLSVLLLMHMSFFSL